MDPLICEAVNAGLYICEAMNEQLFNPRDFELRVDAIPKIRNYKTNANVTEYCNVATAQLI